LLRKSGRAGRGEGRRRGGDDAARWGAKAARRHRAERGDAEERRARKTESEGRERGGQEHAAEASYQDGDVEVAEEFKWLPRESQERQELRVVESLERVNGLRSRR
jgi:hypothetical protein